MIDRLVNHEFEEEAEAPTVREMAEYLCGHLSPEVTAYLSGLDEPDTVQAWAQGQIQPSAEEKSRLEVAYRASQRLVQACGDDMARTWFFGTNRALRNTAPAYVLRHWSRKERASVLSAAQQFAEI
jgi:hypothetical protein